MALDESRRTERAGATTAGEIKDCCCWRRNRASPSAAPTAIFDQHVERAPCSSYELVLDSRVRVSLAGGALPACCVSGAFCA